MMIGAFTEFLWLLYKFKEKKIRFNFQVEIWIRKYFDFSVNQNAHHASYYSYHLSGTHVLISHEKSDERLFTVLTIE